jgi:hypothetical protein
MHTTELADAEFGVFAEREEGGDKFVGVGIPEIREVLFVLPTLLVVLPRTEDLIDELYYLVVGNHYFYLI